MTDDDKQIQVLSPDYTSYLRPPDTLVEKDTVGPCGKAQEGIPVWASCKLKCVFTNVQLFYWSQIAYSQNTCPESQHMLVTC